jgi:ABC-type uncharacterized transport system auxiliary subunit
MMKPATRRNAVFLATALIAATLAGCADVHPNPEPGTLVGQAEASAPQSADAQPQSATNIPF